MTRGIGAPHEHGSALPLFSGLVLVALVVVGLATDVALLHRSYRTAATIADASAEAGAAMIDVGLAHDGLTALDISAAEVVSRETALRQGGVERVEVRATASTVCVDVELRHHTVALAFIGAAEVDVVVGSCASPATG